MINIKTGGGAAGSLVFKFPEDTALFEALKRQFRMRSSCSRFVLSILRVCLVAALWAAGAGPGAAGTIRLSNAAGQVVEPFGKRGQKAVLLFFLTPECPVGNVYAPEMTRIIQHYQKLGVNCFAVYAQEPAADVARHLREFRLPLPGLLDPRLRLAKLTGATVTPEVCLLTAEGKVLYRGRIDDRVVKPGTVRIQPRVRDLRLALDAVLAGKPVAEPVTKAIGCYINSGAAD